MKKLLLLICLIPLFTGYAFGQSKEIQIANEYYFSSQYEKANEKFEQLSKRTQNIPFIYQNYLSTLKNLDKKEDASKFIKKSIKSYPDNFYYKLDQYIILDDMEDSKAKKVFAAVSDILAKNTMEVENAAEYLVKNNKLKAAENLLLEARKEVNEKNAYAVSLAKIYSLQGKKEKMLDEMLNYLSVNPYQLKAVKNNFQNSLKEKEDFDLLEKKLYDNIQQHPENIVFNELLLWLNIQNKNFNAAFLQAKAIDRKGKLQGAKLIDVGRIALDNKDYVAAGRFFQEVVNQSTASHNYSLARRLLIYSKEEAVKNTFPVDKGAIKSLISDYNKLIQDLGKTTQAYEAMRSIAVLYGMYLDQADSATVYLHTVIANNTGDAKLTAKAKIDLADIYLLNDTPWEASLLYSQVENEMKEEPLGYEAKLKNAKVAYYKGEFKLAQAHLDILKMATTREIANNAMDLSLFIQDNTALDTSYAALTEYAAIDLLLYQHKDNEALSRLDTLLVNFPGHSLTDDVYWLKSKIYRRRGEDVAAVAMLDKIIKEYPTDILGDDALFTKGVITEEKLKQPEAAMEIYKDFLFKYPGSIYQAEVRKRFRLLRGDKI